MELNIEKCLQVSKAIDVVYHAMIRGLGDVGIKKIDDSAGKQALVASFKPKSGMFNAQYGSSDISLLNLTIIEIKIVEQIRSIRKESVNIGNNIQYDSCIY